MGCATENRYLPAPSLTVERADAVAAAAAAARVLVPVAEIVAVAVAVLVPVEVGKGFVPSAQKPASHARRLSSSVA